MTTSTSTTHPADAPVINAQTLTKTYTFHRQRPGLLGALRGAIRRRYETRLAVDRLDLVVRPGEVVGLLGPNGAGKTTTLKMLSGLLHPTAGELAVLGFEPARRQRDFLRRIALVMGQKTMLWWEVPAMETMLLHKEMYAIPDAEFQDSLAELSELLDVGHLLGVQVRKTSLGERMRLELMAALLHRPDVVFLDEPTIGLDVVAKARVRAFLAELNRVRGTTIIVTSHDMDDIEALCSRVVIVDHGRIAFDGELAELVRATRPRKVVRATYASRVDADRLATVREQVDLPAVDHADDVLRLEVNRAELGTLLEALPRLGPLADLDVSDADVEDIIRELFSARAAALDGGPMDGGASGAEPMGGGSR